MYLTGSCPFSKRQFSTCKFLSWKYICYSSLSSSYLTYGPRNYNTEISYSPDLIRFIKGSCRLANRKGGSTSAPSPSKFLPDIWIQNLKWEYMYLPGSCTFSKRQFSTCKFLTWKYICYLSLPSSYLTYGPRNWNAIICIFKDPFYFLKGSYLVNC